MYDNEKKLLKESIERSRHHIAEARAMISVNRRVSTYLLLTSKSREEIEAQQKFLQKFNEQEERLNELEIKVNQSEKWLAVL